MNYRFRKKPVVIEAFQMTRERRRDTRDWPQWLHTAWSLSTAEAGAVYPLPPDLAGGPLAIHTLEGEHRVDFGDWIILGVQGELYPCKPSIFAATYDPAD